MLHSQLVVAALAASVSANLFPGHIPIRRDLLLARQTDSAATASATTTGGLSDTECQATLLSVASDFPIPGDDLIDWELAQTATDPCSMAQVPASLSSGYASYSDAVVSWYEASSSELLSAVAECPQYAAAVSGAAVCTTSPGAAAAADTTAPGSSPPPPPTAASRGGDDDNGDGGSASRTATDSAAATGTAASSSPSAAETAGASVREVGVVGAILAGVLGVAVAL